LWSMTATAPAAEPPPAELRERPEPFSSDGPVDLKSLVADLEHRYITHALQRSKGVVADAARMLSLQRTTLIEKMNKYGIERVTA